MRSAEQQAFTAPEGIALRYGLLYGGNVHEMRALLAKRAMPVARGGLLGWVHHDDAAAATVAALEHGRAGEAYNIVDDKPACWEDVISAMAAAVGARPPRRLPGWLLRLAAPYVAEPSRAPLDGRSRGPTTTPATLRSRSRSTPTSFGSPRAA